MIARSTWISATFSVFAIIRWYAVSVVSSFTAPHVMWIATKSSVAIADPSSVPRWLTYPFAPTRRRIHSVRERRDG